MSYEFDVDMLIAVQAANLNQFPNRKQLVSHPEFPDGHQLPGALFFMNSFALFTDVSLNPQRKIGVCGYLLVPVPFLEIKPHDIEHGNFLARRSGRPLTKPFSTARFTKHSTILAFS
ncbi:MAG TPA: hypothetical protein VHN12_04775 [Geobacteraceae bacterium]|nr:hypothetical protein [Geobacteraceae bacterium]